MQVTESPDAPQLIQQVQSFLLTVSLSRIGDELARDLMMQAASMESNRLRQRYKHIILPMQNQYRGLDVLHVPDSAAMTGASIIRVCVPWRSAGQLGFEEGSVAGHRHHVPICYPRSADCGPEVEICSGDG